MALAGPVAASKACVAVASFQYVSVPVLLPAVTAAAVKSTVDALQVVSGFVMIKFPLGNN